MTLATIAHRISTDNSFAELLQTNPDNALIQTGICVTVEERIALQKFLECPGSLKSWGRPLLITGESWAIEL